MNRRALLSLALTGTVCSTSGCLLFAGLLRVGMRGSAIRGGARAARSTPSGHLKSLGRAGAATFQYARLARLIRTAERFRVGDIVAIETEEEVITISMEGQNIEFAIDGIVVSTTTTIGQFMQHYSVIVGPCGSSRAVSDSVIDHWDESGTFVGSDIYHSDKIQHIDETRTVVGVTKLSTKKLEGRVGIASVERDSYLHQQMLALGRAQTGSSAGWKVDLRTLQNSQMECLRSAPSTDCATLKVQADNALKRLEDRFRGFA